MILGLSIAAGVFYILFMVYWIRWFGMSMRYRRLVDDYDKLAEAVFIALERIESIKQEMRRR